jgi:hypothetical protein
VHEFMFKCCCCYLDICCCWIDAMGIIEMVNWWWICCCCWKLWKLMNWWILMRLSWIVVSMIFNEWNKLIMMSYGIMIFCFWLLFGNEEWFGRNRDFHMKLSVNRFEKWVWCEVMENDFWDGWNLNFSIHYDRAKC